MKEISDYEGGYGITTKRKTLIWYVSAIQRGQSTVYGQSVRFRWAIWEQPRYSNVQ